MKKKEKRKKQTKNKKSICVSVYINNILSFFLLLFLGVIVDGKS